MGRFGVMTLGTMLALGIVTAQQSIAIEVYKTSTCSCCAKWVNHLRQHGFSPRVIDVEDIEAIKVRYRIPDTSWSCHTAVVQGYVVEGHVPAKDVRRLLKERPALAGIALPAMPAGSPGMEVASGRVDPYDILAFDKQGKTSVYASFRP